MGKLFGTDGIRGIANSDLSAPLALKIGKAVGYVFTKSSEHTPKVLIGTDTRISGDMLCAALASGLTSIGVDVELLGVVPTPAVALLVSKYGADAGIMVSASHNPAEYNGIKIFSEQGYKLPDSVEDEIESYIFEREAEIPLPKGDDVGVWNFNSEAINDYINHIKTAAFAKFDGIKVVLDCANGSSAVSAAEIFRSLGATCIVLSDKPNGTNINKGCGSTHLSNIKSAVLKHKADIGLSFDGDADRCLAVDERGEEVDGDKIIAIIAKYLKEKNALVNDSVVVTVMSNLGFFKFAENEGIETVKTKVGDRYVLEEMLSGGYVIGGEQSGHVIMLSHASTGDGQLTGVTLLSIMKKSGKKLSELAQVMDKYPQILVNLKFKASEISKYEGDTEIKEKISEWEKKLGDDGRILVRASGTEPLIRVMVEGKNKEFIESCAFDIGNKIKERLAN